MKKIVLLLCSMLLLLVPSPLSAQQQKITGTVTDKGEPLPGVNVIVKGTTIGVVTDANGKYSIDVSGTDAVLVFSFVGYIAKEFPVGDMKVIDILLDEDTREIEEVVVIGYGTQKKVNLTGAVTSVKMDEVLGSRPVSSVSGALMGNIPGLTMSGNSGEPGSGYMMKVRGTSSINGGNPLILVDNVPMEIADINDLNPEDIESVSVLKDASAATVYGARAAFGVILITTKRSEKDKPNRFNYSAKVSLNRPQQLATRATPLQTIKSTKDAGYVSIWTGQDVATWINLLDQYNSNPSLYPDGYAMENGTRYSLKETDLTRDMIDDFGVQQIHDFSVSGGSSKSTYRISLGVLDEDGILVTDKDSYKRFNVSTFLSTDITKWLTTQISVHYSTGKKSEPYSPGLGRNIWAQSVYAPSFYPTGGMEVNGENSPFYTPRNILGISVPDLSKTNRLNLLGRIILTPMEGLNVTGEYSINNSNRAITKYRKPVSNFTDGMTFGPFASTLTQSSYDEEKQNRVYNALNVFATYTKKIQNHNFTVMAGINAEHSDYEELQVKRLQMINDELPSIGQGVGQITADDDYSEFALFGAFYRVNYAFKDRYLLEASGRYDGSSKFPEDHRFGFFPSFSAGWRISEESFMDFSRSVISNLKLRASWGSIGNQNIDPFSYTPGMEAKLYDWLRSGQKTTSLDSPPLVRNNFTWEEVRTLNLGIDVALWSHKLNASFDVFKRETLNMLGPGLGYPSIVGAVAPMQNATDMETYGWELQASWRDKIGDVTYGIGFNISDSKSKITKYKNDAKILPATPDPDPNVITSQNDITSTTYYEGQVLGEIWGYETDRFYTVDDFEEGTLKTTAAGELTGGTLKQGVARVKGASPNPGDILYKHPDENGDIWSASNTLDDPGAKRILGNTSYRYVFGINLDASWKGLGLSVLLQGTAKRQVWLKNNTIIPYATNWFIGVYDYQLDYWRPDNADAFYPRLYQSAGYNTGNNTNVQSRYLLDAAYLDIKSVVLSYDLPKSLISKIKLDKVSVFVNCENLWSFNHFPEGMHPDNKAREEGASYPIMRMFTGGVNITF